MTLRVTDDEYKTLVERTGKAVSVTTSQPVTKRNKYNARRKEVDGHVFHSSGEAKRYLELKQAVEFGLISYLQIQKKYPLVVNGVHVADYVADFVYMDDAELIIEDFKGMRTPVYEMKKKLMLALYGVEILESGVHF